MSAVQSCLTDEALEQWEPLPVRCVIRRAEDELAAVSLSPDLKVLNQVGWDRERPLGSILNLEAIFVAFTYD